MHDLVIRNARIADGLGSPLVDGDLAVDNGRVSRVGEVSGDGRETFDANGQVLAPGIVDMHTHYDAQLLWDSTASPSPALGVTTVVIGNCGFGIVPAPLHLRDNILANLAEVEGMSLATLRQGVDWGFETFAEYLQALRTKGVYPNVAALASHATIRCAVMGADASKRAATAQEIAAMAVYLRDAMDAGAVGLGSSSNENHRGDGGVPIASRLAEQAEFDALADAMADYQHGVFLITTGNHMDMQFMERFSERSGRPSVYAAHFHYSQEPQRGRKLMQGAEAARQRGHAVYTQGACHPLSLAFTLDHAYILKAIAPWPDSSDHNELRRILGDREFRAAFKSALATPTDGRIFTGRWDWVIVTRASERNAALTERTIADIAAERGQDPLDVFLDLGLDENFETFYTLWLLNVDEDGVEELIRNDGTLISLSDAGAHNSLLCDAAYGMHLLSHWVRERAVFDLPTAIRKLTSDPADVYGLVDRGRLTPGAHADMMLFDPDTLSVSKLERHFDLPAGGERMMRRAPGLVGTWVNGVRVFDGTEYLQHAHGPGQVITTFSTDQPRLGMR